MVDIIILILFSWFLVVVVALFVNVSVMVVVFGLFMVVFLGSTDPLGGKVWLGVGDRSARVPASLRFHPNNLSVLLSPAGVDIRPPLALPATRRSC